MLYLTNEDILSTSIEISVICNLQLIYDAEIITSFEQSVEVVLNILEYAWK
jgi:hypothetical protein